MKESSIGDLHLLITIKASLWLISAYITFPVIKKIQISLRLFTLTLTQEDALIRTMPCYFGVMGSHPLSSTHLPQEWAQDRHWGKDIPPLSLVSLQKASWREMLSRDTSAGKGKFWKARAWFFCGFSTACFGLYFYLYHTTSSKQSQNIAQLRTLSISTYNNQK